MSGNGEAWTVKDSDTLQHFVAYVTARHTQGITYSIQRPNRTGQTEQRHTRLFAASSEVTE
jgi:hypothetical protein